MDALLTVKSEPVSSEIEDGLLWFGSEMEGIQKQEEENFADFNVDGIKIEMEIEKEPNEEDPHNGTCAVEIKQEPLEKTENPVEPTYTDGGVKIKTEPQQEIKTVNSNILVNSIPKIGPGAYLIINGKLIKLKTQPLLHSEVDIKPDAAQQATPAPSTASSKYKFLCGKCNFPSKDIETHRYHMSSHTIPKRRAPRIKRPSTKPPPPPPKPKPAKKPPKPQPLYVFKCTKCEFKTSDSSTMQTHVTSFHSCDSNQNLFRCQLCLYETPNNTDYNRHLDIHKEPDEIKMYRCNVCAFETKYQRALNCHAVRHQDISEVRVFQCDKCSFQSRHRNSVKKHIIRFHVDQSLVSTFKCDQCSYTSKFKTDLNSHMIIHRDDRVYKCKQCRFDTKRSGNLKQHILLVHKKPGEVKMHKCVVCSYESKLMWVMKNHELTHEDPKGERSVKCQKCHFKSKFIHALKDHISKEHEVDVEKTTSSTSEEKINNSVVAT